MKSFEHYEKRSAVLKLGTIKAQASREPLSREEKIEATQLIRFMKRKGWLVEIDYLWCAKNSINP